MIKSTPTALLAIAMQMTGCASLHNNIAPERDAWQGASYEEVVSRWGMPVRSTSFNDGRIAYTWLSEGISSRRYFWPSIGVSAGSGMGVGIGIGIGTGGSRDVPVTCERTVVFQDGRVVNQTWYGPTDYCATFRRSG